MFGKKRRIGLFLVSDRRIGASGGSTNRFDFNNEKGKECNLEECVKGWLDQEARSGRRRLVEPDVCFCFASTLFCTCR